MPKINWDAVKPAFDAAVKRYEGGPHGELLQAAVNLLAQIEKHMGELEAGTSCHIGVVFFTGLATMIVGSLANSHHSRAVVTETMIHHASHLIQIVQLEGEEKVH